MAPIVSHAADRLTTVCNQATSVPAHPIECHRARRERCSYTIAQPLRTEQPSLDSLENTIGTSRKSPLASKRSEIEAKADVQQSADHFRI